MFQQCGACAVAHKYEVAAQIVWYGMVCSNVDCGLASCGTLCCGAVWYVMFCCGAA